MSSTRDSGDWTGLRRLPSVRERLSGFVRRGRGLSRKKTMSVLGEDRDERPSMDESLKTGLPRVQVQDFGTSSLEIDLQALEAFRNVPQPRSQRTDKQQQQQKPPPTSSSTTPIADMFARRAPILESAAGNTSSLTKPSHAKSPLAKSSLTNSSPDKSSLTKSSLAKPSPNKSSPLNEISVNRAGRAAPEGRRSSLAPSHTAKASGPVVSVTIISSDHAQPQPAKPWPPPETPHVAAPIRNRGGFTTSDSKQPARMQLREPRRAAYAPSSAGPIAAPEPIARYRLNVSAAAAEAEKRHSTPTVAPLVITTPGSLSAGGNRTDRRRSWQPAPTSVPSGMSTPSGPPSASAPWRNLANRQTSARLATDRLSWIRELEEGRKNKSTISSDLPVLKTVQGSVADKLAKFESKQQQQQLAPLTRSNSTRSRPSSIADTFSSYGGVATTRSSLDSHRTSSVFSHYDDSFREKMEFITGNANRKADEEKEEKPALTRVTSAFVSVERGYKPTCIDKPQEV